MAALLINIDVDDLDRGIAFYTQAFELSVGRRFGRHGVELLGAGSPIYLLVKQAGTAAFPGGGDRDYARHWTPVHIDFAVDDIEAALARAEAAGARRESDIQTQAWGKLVMLADPFGHGVCLLSFAGRGYDEIASS